MTDTPEWNHYLRQFTPDMLTSIPWTSDKYCVILEPRKDPRLVQVVCNFMSILQREGWGLYIFHGTKNKNWIQTALSSCRNIHYESLGSGIDNLTISQYNNILCSAAFWRGFQSRGCKHVLIFQIDTILLHGDLDRFLSYDYVGAPWCYNQLKIGNGGLSLRKVDVMLDIIRKYPRYIVATAAPSDPPIFLENEDVYFAFYLQYEKEKYNLPSVEVASEFSVETVFYNDPCGMHNPHRHLIPWDEMIIVQKIRKEQMGPSKED